MSGVSVETVPGRSATTRFVDAEKGQIAGVEKAGSGDVALPAASPFVIVAMRDLDSPPSDRAIRERGLLAC